MSHAGTLGELLLRERQVIQACIDTLKEIDDEWAALRSQPMVDAEIRRGLLRKGISCK